MQNGGAPEEAARNMPAIDARYGSHHSRVQRYPCSVPHTLHLHSNLQLLSCQYLYFGTGKASKVSAWRRSINPRQKDWRRTAQEASFFASASIIVSSISIFCFSIALSSTPGCFFFVVFIYFIFYSAAFQSSCSSMALARLLSFF